MTPLFHYRARTLAGAPISGSLTAPNHDTVIANLRTRALIIVTVEQRRAPLRELQALLVRPRVKLSVRVAFLRSFATLIEAGIPLHRSLNVLVERCEDPGLVEITRTIIADIEQGASLGTAFGRHPRVFTAPAIALIQAGEAAGVLDEALERVATLAERDAALRRRIHAAAAYPLIVLSVAGALVVFLLAKIVPLFTSVFVAFELPLPAPTAALIAVSAALQGRAGIELIGGTLLLAALTTIAGRTTSVRAARDAIALRLPIFGQILRRCALARLTLALATLLRSGIDLVRALEIVIPIAGNAAFTAALQRVAAALRGGSAFAPPLAGEPIIDPLLVALVRAGEESGRLETLLARAATYFEADAEAAIAALGTTLEPVLVVGLGSIVGFIVLAIFLPLYTLVGNVAR